MLHTFWVFIVGLFYDGEYPLTRSDLNGISSPSYSRDQMFLRHRIDPKTSNDRHRHFSPQIYSRPVLLQIRLRACVLKQPEKSAFWTQPSFCWSPTSLPAFPVFPPFKIRHRLRAATRPSFVHGVLRFCSFVRFLQLPPRSALAETETESAM